MSDIRCVLPARALLGEGPLWDPEDRALYWVDIKGRGARGPLSRLRPAPSGPGGPDDSDPDPWRAPHRHDPEPRGPWRTLDGSAVTIEDGLWARRQVTNRDAALPHGYRMLEVEGHAVDPARYNLMAISPSITGIFTLPPERRPA